MKGRTGPNMLRRLASDEVRVVLRFLTVQEVAGLNVVSKACRNTFPLEGALRERRMVTCTSAKLERVRQHEHGEDRCRQSKERKKALFKQLFVPGIVRLIIDKKHAQQRAELLKARYDLLDIRDGANEIYVPLGCLDAVFENDTGNTKVFKHLDSLAAKNMASYHHQKRKQCGGGEFDLLEGFQEILNSRRFPALQKLEICVRDMQSFDFSLMLATPTLTALHVKSRSGDLGSTAFRCADPNFKLPHLKTLCMSGKFRDELDAARVLGGVPQLEKLTYSFSFATEAWLALKGAGVDLKDLQVGGTQTDSVLDLFPNIASLLLHSDAVRRLNKYRRREKLATFSLQMDRHSPGYVSQETLRALPQVFPQITALTLRHGAHVSIRCLATLQLTSLKMEMCHFTPRNFSFRGFAALEKLMVRSCVVYSKSSAQVTSALERAGRELAHCGSLGAVELSQLFGNEAAGTNALCGGYFRQLRELHNRRGDGERIGQRLGLLIVDSTADSLPGSKAAFSKMLLHAGEYAPSVAEQILHEIKPPFANGKRLREVPPRRKKYELAREHFLYENGVCVHEESAKVGFLSLLKTRWSKIFRK